MSHNEIEVDAPPGAVWEVLAHPPTYPEWVVGNKAIRRHDGDWPAPGAEFHHRIGFGPFTVKDKTVSLEATPPSLAAHAVAAGGPDVDGCLTMNVRVLPFGHGIVTFELAGEGGKTMVRMAEIPAGGPAKILWPVLDPLVKVRNVETLRRLKRLAETRHQAQASAG